jgi:hypothetical protein
MKSEMKNDVKLLDEEFCEILVAILRFRDDAGVEECVDYLRMAKSVHETETLNARGEPDSLMTHLRG